MTPAVLAAAAAAVAVLCWPAPRRALAVPAAGRRARPRAAAVAAGQPGNRREEPVDQLLHVLDMVAGQVRAGASPSAAWAAAVELCDGVAVLREADPVAAIEGWGRQAARSGSRSRAAAASGAAAAAAAAAAWRLAERTGAPLADLLDTVCTTLRDDRTDRAAVAAALAGPRATSRLLLALPVGGLALGELLGAAPVQVLTQTSVGRVCAVCGAGLLVLGRLWMRRLVASVEVLASGRPGAGSAVSAGPA